MFSIIGLCSCREVDCTDMHTQANTFPGAMSNYTPCATFEYFKCHIVSYIWTILYI